MTLSSLDGATGTWAGTSVDVAGIERALAQLWKAEGQRELADGRQPPVRTSVMNLVVYIPRAEEVAAVTDTIGALAQQHPSRTILVVADPGAPTSSLDASVSSQCSAVSPAYGRLCWEQVTITAHGATAIHAPGIAIPLLLPDLPVYLWWTGDLPFGTDLFDRMIDLCDRLIVDSALLAHPINGLARLAAISRATGADRGVSDFHWIRLTPWRNLLAQFYDKDELRPYAACIESVRIGYAREGDGGSIAQALLLAGWLASRLDWSPRPEGARLEEDTWRLEAERAGATVVIEIAPQPSGGATGGDLISVTVMATLGDIPAVLSIERRAEDSEATTATKIGDAGALTHTVRMATRSASELLAQELQMFRHDRVYEDALGAVADLCSHIGTEEQ